MVSQRAQSASSRQATFPVGETKPVSSVTSRSVDAGPVSLSGRAAGSDADVGAAVEGALSACTAVGPPPHPASAKIAVNPPTAGTTRWTIARPYPAACAVAGCSRIQLGYRCVLIFDVVRPCSVGSRSRSSVGERPPHTRKVAGSKPAGTTMMFPRFSADSDGVHVVGAIRRCPSTVRPARRVRWRSESAERWSPGRVCAAPRTPGPRRRCSAP